MDLELSEDFVQRQRWSQMNAQRDLPYKIVHNCDHTEMKLRLENFTKNYLFTEGS